MFGYYGFGNAGDEAVLAGIVAGLRREGWAIDEADRADESGKRSRSPSLAGGTPRLHVTVISGDPERTRQWHGLNAVSRSDWRGVWRLAGEADAWIFGGGSLLQDVTSRFTLPYYWAVVRLAQRRTPVLFHAQGIGPLKRWTSRLLVRRLLRRMRRISVRDEASARLARALAGERCPVVVGADPVWLLPAPSAAARRAALTAAIRRTGGALPGEWIGVALRPWDGWDALVPRLAGGLREVAGQAGAGVLLVPMHDGIDEPVARALQAELAAAGVLAAVGGAGAPPSERMSLLGACRIVVAMRLHALLFAAAQGVGGVALAYDPKVKAAAERLRWRAVDPGAWRSVDWAAVMTAAWEETASLREERMRAADEERRAAEADAAGLSKALAALAAEKR